MDNQEESLAWSDAMSTPTTNTTTTAAGASSTPAPASTSTDPTPGTFPNDLITHGASSSPTSSTKLQPGMSPSGIAPRKGPSLGLGLGGTVNPNRGRSASTSMGSGGGGGAGGSSRLGIDSLTDSNDAKASFGSGSTGAVPVNRSRQLFNADNVDHFDDLSNTAWGGNAPKPTSKRVTLEDEEQDEQDDGFDFSANGEGEAEDEPLHQRERIRGLETHQDFNFFKNKNTGSSSFFTRPTPARGILGNSISRTESPRIGLASRHGPIRQPAAIRQDSLNSEASSNNGRHSPTFFQHVSQLAQRAYYGNRNSAATSTTNQAYAPLIRGGRPSEGTDTQSESDRRSSVDDYSDEFGNLDSHRPSAAFGQGASRNEPSSTTAAGSSFRSGVSGSDPRANVARQSSFALGNPSPISPGGINPYHDDAVDWMVEGTGMRVGYDDFTTIDWIHDFAEERQRVRKLHRTPGLTGQIAVMSDWIQSWVVVLAVGIAAGIVAGGSDIASQWLGDVKEGYCVEGFYLNRSFCCWGLDETDVCPDWIPWASATFVVGYSLYILFALLFAVTAAYLVKTYAPYAEGSGIPEVKTILGGFVIRHYLGVETLVIKTVTLVLSTASGLSLGKEGPLLHIACCIGNILPRVFPKFKRNEAKMREILSAAASAGISVAFGAPIGGVVFSLEEMSYYFSSDTMWHSFFCAMAAAVALKLMDPFRTEKLVVFQVQYDRNWHGFEMIFYMFLGVLGGLWGAFFIRMNLKLAAFRKTSWLRLFPVYEVFAVCLVTSVVGYLNIFTRVQSPQLLANLFRACDGNPANSYHGLCDDGGVTFRVFSLLAASGVKGVLTIVTFGLAIPAGIFMPSMVIGALFGRALGMMIHAWQTLHPGFWLFASCAPDVPCVTPGSYAMVGAAAFMGGVTRMTVSLVIIMFELTGALTYVLPIMIVVMTSKWVGDAFGKEGIFDGIILLSGYPFLDDKEEYRFNTTAAKVMTPVEDIVVITATGNTLDSLDNLLHETHYKGYPVVSSLRDMMVVGYISRAELRYAIDEARKRNLPGSTPAGNVVPILESTPAFLEFRLWMDQTPITVSHRFPMDQVIVIFRKLGVRYVLCTQHGQLLGLITKKDVLRHLALMQHPEEQNLPMHSSR